MEALAKPTVEMELSEKIDGNSVGSNVGDGELYEVHQGRQRHMIPEEVRKGEKKEEKTEAMEEGMEQEWKEANNAPQPESPASTSTPTELGGLHAPEPLLGTRSTTSNNTVSNAVILRNSQRSFSANLERDLARLPGLPKNPVKGVPPGIFSNSIFTISHSDLGGYGAFSVAYIPAGTNILIEKALLFASDPNVVKARLLLSEEEANIFDSLSRHPALGIEPWGNAGKWQQIFNTNKYVMLLERNIY